MDIISNSILTYFAGAKPVSDTLDFCLHKLEINKHIVLNDCVNQIYIDVKREKRSDEFSNGNLMHLHYSDMVLTR